MNSRQGSPIIKHARVAVAIAAALITVPASASASTVALTPGADELPTTIEYKAAAGEANKLDVQVSADGLTAEVGDAGAGTITPGTNCTAQNAKKVTCTVPGGRPRINEVTAELGDLNDSFKLAGTNGDADGGPGNDNLDGGELRDILRGGTGIDNLDGKEGDDTLSDGDVTGQSVNKDTVNGGPGNDFVDYSGRTATVTVDLADNGGDGENGENDTVNGVENVSGGSGGDFIRGDANPNILQGNDGDDTADGRDGNDYLGGSKGNDTLIGGSGRDDIEAGEGDDLLRLENPVGQYDRLLTCSAGKDTIVGLAAAPSVEIGCEIGDLGFGFVTGLKPKSVGTTSVTLKLPCPEAYRVNGVCKGSVVVEPKGAYAHSDADRKKQRYGVAKFAIDGASGKVKINLNSAGRKQLKKSAFKLQFTVNLKETATKTKRRFEWTSYLVRSFLR